MTTLVRRAPTAVYVGIGIAWSVALAAQAAGASEFVHHDELIEGSLNPAVALGLFLVAWQLMTAAMMLPSSMPMIRLYWSTARAQERPGAALASFLGGEAVVGGGVGGPALRGGPVP